MRRNLTKKLQKKSGFSFLAAANKPDNNGQIRNQTFGPFPPDKKPSKVLGPLSVYANEENSPTNNLDDPLRPPQPPHLSPDENPFIRKPLVPKKPAKPPLHPTDHQISIHGPGNSEDLLQFLQQHPEISNLPSGSVLEIKPVVTGQPNSFHVNDINFLQPNIQKPPMVLLHPQQGHVPEDISLEQILQELHKNVNPHGVPFPHTPPHFGHDQSTSGSKTTNKTANARPQGNDVTVYRPTCVRFCLNI